MDVKHVAGTRDRHVSHRLDRARSACEDRDPVGEGDRLHEIVGDEHDGAAAALPQSLQLVLQDQPPGVVRFIGVDGYRWMIRCVVNGPQDRIAALAAEARNALADTVVRRGETPLPVRTPLEVQLPEPMAAQLRAAAEQAAQQPEQAQQPDQQPPPPEPVARRSEQGSAMQQLRTITGG